MSSRLSYSELSELCRVLRHCVGAGLTVANVFRQQAGRGRAQLRPAAARIATALENGDSLEDALARERPTFPHLFVALLRVAENTGMVPEVCGELEKYYARQDMLKRRFLAQITWPVIQFFLAVFVLAALIWIMGLLAGRNPGQPPFDPLGLGLLGTRGALIFLAVIFGTLGGVFAAYRIARRKLQGPAVDARLLRVPALGPCLRALALGRFSLALGLTTEAGMVLPRALRLSFRATDNDAFAAASSKAEKVVKAGDELARALGRTGLFPEEYLHIIEVGEESGRLPEVLRQQAVHYDDEAGRRLKALAATAGYGTWTLVAIFIIIAIFRIALSYIGMLG